MQELMNRHQAARRA